MPVTPVLSGNPVAFVSVPDAGVPSAGVVNDGDENVPPVMVFPVNVMALGSDRVGFPETPSPLLTVSSFAVPVMVRAEPVPDPVLAQIPFVEFDASAARSESYA